jgi:hypothetical protein
MFDTLTFEEAIELHKMLANGAKDAYEGAGDLVTRYDTGDELSDLSQEVYRQVDKAYRDRYPHYNGEAF